VPAAHRWCVFTRPGPKPEAAELWVIDVTLAAAGQIPRCDGAGADCVRLTTTLWTGQPLGGLEQELGLAPLVRGGPRAGHELVDPQARQRLDLEVHPVVRGRALVQRLGGAGIAGVGGVERRVVEGAPREQTREGDGERPDEGDVEHGAFRGG